MKSLAAIFLALSVLSSTALADPVPASIQKALKPFSLQSVGFSSGVLRIVASRPVLNWEMYDAVTMAGVCAALYDDKKTAAKITRIEVWNAIEAQGYALEGGGKTCLEYGALVHSDAKKFIEERTQECIARVCRKR